MRISKPKGKEQVIRAARELSLHLGRLRIEDVLHYHRTQQRTLRTTVLTLSLAPPRFHILHCIRLHLLHCIRLHLLDLLQLLHPLILQLDSSLRIHGLEGVVLRFKWLYRSRTADADANWQLLLGPT